MGTVTSHPTELHHQAAHRSVAMSLSKIALFGLAAVAGMAQAANFELTIMHTNDVHARITSSDEKGEYVNSTSCHDLSGPHDLDCVLPTLPHFIRT
jgi:2',3'-cyclic-nucleotide 2'-phosphodiesterase (5'-nucleotidase family)